MLYVDLELQLQTFFNVRENILTLATITHSSYFFFFFTFFNDSSCLSMLNW